MDLDVIVIGAGLGRLTAAAKLAKTGKKVIVIDPNYNPGGCATTFKRKKYTLEVGLHEMDGLDELDIKTSVFQELDVFKHVDIVSLPHFYRFVHRNIEIDIPDNVKKAMEVLINMFPDEEKGIRKFFDVVTDLRKEICNLPLDRWKIILLMPVFPLLFPNVFKYQNKSVGDFLDSIIDDELLKLILVANLTYYHDNVRKLSLLYFAVAQGSYFIGGSH